MRFATSIRTAGRVLARLASASAVRIALGATLTTPQPVAALRAVPSPAAQFAVPPADDTVSGAATRDSQTQAEPGPGWG